MKVFILSAKRIKQKMTVFFLLLVIVTGVVLSYRISEKSRTVFSSVDKKVIVIDAGHGGYDPGKSGKIGEDEKDINLKISGYLTEYLEQGGAVVVLTRNEDTALGSAKKEDMKQRKNIVNESDADIMISIHQNAFTSSVVKGAQVFYHESSEKGKLLSECVQKRLVEKLDPSNKRQAKQNKNYYVLRTTEIPAAIIECGFLSNAEEEKLLNDEEYQQNVAWAIYIGILDYFEKVSML
ncbi:MAG: N-acetylmuramoyl-L-alanine amidase CwlD [Lachnospiraceae bacterium]|nr:N-acetylmuramoyl-L-alanine amidase CwlD [Lachnospiraceae bacterium]